MCCGGKLYDRDAYFQCCGNNERGIPYNDNTQMCCMWQYGNEYVIHNKTQGAWCCGSELFDPAESPGQSCCNSWTNKPAIFSSTTEMCCEGQVGFSGDTAYTSCCGAISYDRRIASCPCHDGQVQIGASELTAACCQNSDGTKAPYNTETEGCCNGLVYDNSLQFCCNGLVGEVGTEVCCGDSIASKSANQTGSSCCLLNDGSTVVYDPTQQLCCGGALVDNLGNLGDRCCGNVAYNSLTQSCCEGIVTDAAGQICCNGNVFDTETAGDACCNDVPYFSSDSTCCSGEIQLGDRCCGNIAYNSLTQFCCEEIVTPSVYIYPSCCVNATFDSYVQTCCGGIVYDNPEIISTITGEIEVSHQTRCCGDFSNDQTLLPYDYATSTCCNGNIVDLGGLDPSLIECCGGEVMNTEISTCCEGVVINKETSTCCEGAAVDRWYGDATGCCNGTAMNLTDSICCGNNVIANDANTECCGSTGMDSTLFKCCDGVPRSLNGVPADKAICCGQGCIDGTQYFCCDGKQYQKGNPDGIDVSGLTCDSLFP
uniref:Galaxin n=1 Tax=Phallusia mammillata TaxID=59560 RepID=A0A6F9DX07_9ASCI|nr:galaxin [Phallusia mammillata]